MGKIEMKEMKEMEEEEEEEEEEEIIQNEEPLQPINDVFKKLVLNTKKTLYKNIILAPSLNTKNAQDNKLLVLYLKKLTSIHLLCLDVQYRILSDEELNKVLKKYPNEARIAIKDMIKWLMIFFSKNNLVDILPYTDYLETQLHRHPLVQK